MERLLGIDYGRKRLGLAGADPLGITVQPLEAVPGPPEAALKRIVEVCDEREIDRIVVGLPFNMDGTEGEMAAEVRRFGAKLEARSERPVVYCDERLSSWGAEQELRVVSKKSRKREEGRIDAMAAAQILRDFMGRRESPPRRAEEE